MANTITDQLTSMAAEIGTQDIPASCAFAKTGPGKLIISTAQEQKVVQDTIYHLMILCSIKQALIENPELFALINAKYENPSDLIAFFNELLKQVSPSMASARISEASATIENMVSADQTEQMTHLEIMLADQEVLFEIDTIWRKTLYHGEELTTTHLQATLQTKINQSVFIIDQTTAQTTPLGQQSSQVKTAKINNNQYNAALSDWARGQLRQHYPQHAVNTLSPGADQTLHPDMLLLNHLLLQSHMRSCPVHMSKSCCFHCEATIQTVMNLTNQQTGCRKHSQAIQATLQACPCPLPEFMIDLIECDPQIKNLNLNPTRPRKYAPLSDYAQFYAEYTKTTENLRHQTSTVSQTAIVQITNLSKEKCIPIAALGYPLALDPKQACSRNDTYTFGQTPPDFTTKEVKPRHHPSDSPSLVAEGASLVLDFVPIVGTAKSVIETATGKDLVTGEPINRWLAAGGILLGLVPFGKVLTKGKKGEALATKIIKNEKVEEEIAALQRIGERRTSPEFLEKQNLLKEKRQGYIAKETDKLISGETQGVNFSPHDTHSNYNFIGRDGTFVTNEEHVARALRGKLKRGSPVLRITPAEAELLETALGLERGSVKRGGYITFVDHVNIRNPRLPIEGNRFFKGPGMGLPGNGVEVVVDSVATKKGLPVAGPLGKHRVEVIVEGASK